jgi:hypothetical protein
MVMGDGLAGKLKSARTVMVCGVAEEPRKLLPSAVVAVTVHVPCVAVMVTTPPVIEHSPPAPTPIVNTPSPVEVAAGV